MRITLSLSDYLAFGRHDFHACVSCGHVGNPRPVNLHGLHGIERECAACLNHCAVRLEQAVSEGWLTVLDDHGRVLNDTRQSTSEVR